MRFLPICSLLCLSVCQGAAGVSERVTSKNRMSLIPAGKEVDAIDGDVAIGNDRMRGIVAAAVRGRHASMTVRSVAGCLIDLAVRHHESDQLGAFYPGRRRYPFRKLQVLPDGRVTATAPGTATRPEYRTTYTPDADHPAVLITSTWTNTGDRNLSLQPQDDLRVDGGKEDQDRSSPGTADFFFVHDIHWQQAYGILADGCRIRISGNDRESVLNWIPRDGSEITLAPGESWSLTRRIIVGRDLPEVRAVIDELQGRSVHPLQVTLRDAAGTPIERARVTFSSGSDRRGTAVSDAAGRVAVRLPAGTWELTATSDGVRLPESGRQTCRVVPGENRFEWRSAFRRGYIKGQVTDGRGRPIPAKLQFLTDDASRQIDRGPVTGEHFVRNVVYTHDGRFAFPQPAGSYDVIISRGPEYDARFTTVRVESGQTVHLNARLKRVVRTPGWVSADFHSHSSPSGDNTSSQRGRVLNLVCEHIEFAPCTEHNRVSSYAPHIEALGLEEELATVTGMELTGRPLPLNHQNVFPMVHRPFTQDGGGPQTDQSPERQIERLAAWDGGREKLIIQDHPDIGWFFFDQDGDGSPDRGFERAFGLIDVMEVHPIDRILKIRRYAVADGKPVANHRMLNWLQLLNQGFRIYGVVNTDAHDNFHGSGGLRNWVQSSTDDPARIESEEIRVAAEQGRLIMSNGPFLEAAFRASGSPTAFVSGQDMTAADGQVRVDVRVQCPNWFDIDTVMVLVNGRQRPEYTYTRASHATLFRQGPVRFEHRISVRLDSDAHLIVVAGHAAARLGDVPGPRWGRQHPTAVTNPVFVDVDGGGFQPAGDTLGYPLPVRFDESRAVQQ